MRGNDPIEALGSANPIRTDKLAGPSSAKARALFEEITMTTPTLVSNSDATSSPRRRRRIRRIVLVPVVAAGAIGLAAAGWAIAPHPVTQQSTVGCYGAANLGAETVVVDGGSNPIGSCAAQWAKGSFGAPSDPQLAACVLASGGVGVFPTTDGDAVCSELNLAVPTKPYPDAAGQTFVSFKHAVVADFASTSCMSPTQAETTVRADLTRYGLSSWTITSGSGFTNERPCAGLAFDTAQHTVVLVPQPAGT